MISEANKQVGHLRCSFRNLGFGARLVCLGIQIVRLQVLPSEDIVVVPGLVELQVNLLSIRIDDHNASICGGIMVGVSDDTNDQVHANVLVTHAVMEGQHGLAGQLLNHINDLVECVNFNSQVGQLSFNLLYIGKEDISSDTGFGVASLQDLQLLQQVIHPAGHINVDITLNCFQADVGIRVCTDTSRNDGSIGSQAGNIDRIRVNESIDNVLLVIPLDGLIFHIDGGLGGLDYQSANALTCVGDVACVITDDHNSGDGVSTRMNRSSGACVRHSVGLHANIVVLNAVLTLEHVAGLVAFAVLLVGNQHVAFHAVLRHIEDLIVTLVVHNAGGIHEFHIQSLRHNHNGTHQRLGIEHFITPVDNQRDLNIRAHIQLGLVHLKRNVAIDIHAQEDLANLSGGLLQGVAVVIDLDCMGTSVESASAQQGIGNDIVIIVLVPDQVDLGAVGSNHNSANAKIGGVVGIRRDSADHISTDISGNIAANDNLNVGNFGGKAVDHVQQHTEVLLVLGTDEQSIQSIHSSLQLAELHGSAVRKADIQASALQQSIRRGQQTLQLLGQHQLHLSYEALQAIVQVDIRDIKASNEVDSLHTGRISGNHIADGVELAFLPLEQAVVHTDIDSSLVNLNCNGSLAGLVVNITGKLDGNFRSIRSGQILHFGNKLNAHAVEFGAARVNTVQD